MCTAVLRPTRPIPRPPFTVSRSGVIAPKGVKVKRIDIYVVILLEQRGLISAEQEALQEKLHQTIKIFGRKVGMSALVVCFLDDKGNPDFERNSTYERRFGLSAKKAPHIVLLSTHPDRWRPADKSVILSLDRTPVDRVHIILAEVADYVYKGKIPRYRMKLRLLYEASKKWLNDHEEEIIRGTELVAKGLEEIPKQS
jgi:hypothetical protein